MHSENSSATSARLLLASASQRRAQILSGLGVAFDVVRPDLAEAHYPADPRRTALENAQRKNAWARERFPTRPVLTADTIVAFENRCISKPGSIDEAFVFLRAFSGKTQSVFTGVVFSRPGASTPQVSLERSEVTFKALTDATIRRYFDRVNPLDKAGAYNIEQQSDLIVDSFSGSLTNIMGLPVEIVSAWLRAACLWV